MTERRDIDLDGLGFDAKVLAAAWFGLGMKSTVTLQLRESRPAPRTQAAIDELVAAGVAAMEPFNEFGGRVYRPLVDCGAAFRWMSGIIDDEKTAALARWTLYERIDEDQAYGLMTPFGQGVWDKEKRGRKPRGNPHDAQEAPVDHAQWRKGHRMGAKP